MSEISLLEVDTTFGNMDEYEESQIEENEIPTTSVATPPHPKIISRMILPTTCDTCNKLGHTSKYCKQIIFTDSNNIPYLSVFPTLSSKYNNNTQNNIPLTFSTIYAQDIQIHTYIQSATQYLSWSQHKQIDKQTKQYYLEQSIYYTKTAESYVNKYYLECFHTFEVL